MPYSLNLQFTSHTIYVFVVLLLSLWAGHYWVVRQIFKGAFAVFKIELMKEINGTYVRTKVCDACHESIIYRIERLEDASHPPIIRDI